MLDPGIMLTLWVDASGGMAGEGIRGRYKYTALWTTSWLRKPCIASYEPGYTLCILQDPEALLLLVHKCMEGYPRQVLTPRHGHDFRLNPMWSKPGGNGRPIQ